MENKIIKSKLFPTVNEHEFDKFYDKLLIDPDSVYYISIPIDANKISKIIYNFCLYNSMDPTKVTITDGTAGVGGNVISFAQYFYRVNAIEIDKKRFNYLLNNTSVYQLKNIKCFNTSCIELLKVLDTDIIFLDPPWGGSSYKLVDKIKININSIGKVDTGIIELEDLCIDLFNTSPKLKIICLKLPHNYDLEYLYNKFKFINKNIYIYNLLKMNIIIIC